MLLKALFENIEENPDAVENYINAGIIRRGEIEKQNDSSKRQ